MERRQRPCHGVGFQEEDYNVVIGPKPWPCTTACCCLCQGLGGCVLNVADCFPGCFCLLLCCSLISLPILLPVLNFIGSQAPRTELEAVTIHNFNLTRDDAHTRTPYIDPWLLNANFTVSFQARNPSWVVGFRHRYLYTVVSALQLAGESKPVPEFSVGHRSARQVGANMVISEQRISHAMGFGLQSDMQNLGSVRFTITVDSYVMVKRFQWQDPKWFQLSCWVDVSMRNSTVKAGNLLNKICPWVEFF